MKIGDDLSTFCSTNISMMLVSKKALLCMRNEINHGYKMMIVYHFHRQTGWSTVEANVTQQFIRDQLISCPDRVYHLYRTVTFTGKQPRRSETGIKVNTNFRLEYSYRKNRTTFSDVPLLQGIFRWNEQNSHTLYLISNRIFRNLLVN